MTTTTQYILATQISATEWDAILWADEPASRDDDGSNAIARKTVTCDDDDDLMDAIRDALGADADAEVQLA